MERLIDVIVASVPTTVDIVWIKVFLDSFRPYFVTLTLPSIILYFIYKIVSTVLRNTMTESKFEVFRDLLGIGSYSVLTKREIELTSKKIIELIEKHQKEGGQNEA